MPSSSGSEADSARLVGKRISVGPHRGTVRFVGQVPPTKGTWLGIEWDDAARGKHDGTSADGTKYFDVRVPGSGSFIRPTASKLSFGCSFLEALENKYLPSPESGGSSDPNAALPKPTYTRKNLADIEIETPNMDGVIRRVARLDRLTHVGLGGWRVFANPEQDLAASVSQDPESYAEVACAFDSTRGESSGRIRSTCPRITWLDLSRSLLPNWDEVAMIASELDSLQVLLLHLNRLEPLTKPVPESWSQSFASLKDLRLDATHIKWQELLYLSSALPNLEVLQLGSNSISSLTPTMSAPPGASPFPKLKELNLETNAIDDWTQVANSLRSLPLLEVLHLTDNLIATIPPCDTGIAFPSLRHVSLVNNPVSRWTDIDNLATWFPSSLEGFSLNIVPFDEHANGPNRVGSGDDQRASQLVRAYDQVRDFRAVLVARLGRLTVLDRSPVDARERRDAELYVFHQLDEGNIRLFTGKKSDPADRDTVLSRAEKEALLPRFAELSQRYGAGDTEAEGSLEHAQRKQEQERTRQLAQGTLRAKLIQITVVRRTEQPVGKGATSIFEDEGSNQVKLLASTPLRLAKVKLAKVVGVAPTAVAELWAVLKARETGENISFALEDLSRDLAWYEIGEGDCIAVIVKT